MSTFEVGLKAFILYYEMALSLQGQWAEGYGLKLMCLGVKLTRTGLVMVSLVNLTESRITWRLISRQICERL